MTSYRCLLAAAAVPQLLWALVSLRRMHRFAFGGMMGHEQYNSAPATLAGQGTAGATRAASTPSNGELHRATVEALLSAQFPPAGCRHPSCRFVEIPSVYTAAGFGSGMTYYRSCLTYALGTNRTLLPLEDGTRLGGYLRPWSGCTRRDAEEVAAATGLDLDGTVVVPCGKERHVLGAVGSAAGGGVPVPPPFDRIGDALWFEVHVLGFLARPTDEMLALLPAPPINSTYGYEHEHEHAYAAAHVRRGDKVSEAAPVPSEYYLSDLEEALAGPTRQTTTVATTRTLHVFTDEPQTVREEMRMASELPHRRIQFRVLVNGRELQGGGQLPHTSGGGTSNSVTRSWKEINDGQRRAEREDLARTLVTLSAADPIAVTLTSNLGWLTMAMKIYRDLETGRRSGTIVAVNPNSWSGYVVPDRTNRLGADLFWSEADCGGPHVGQLGGVGGVRRPYEETRGYNLPCTTRPTTFTYFSGSLH